MRWSTCSSSSQGRNISYIGGEAALNLMVAGHMMTACMMVVVIVGLLLKFLLLLLLLEGSRIIHLWTNGSLTIIDTIVAVGVVVSY